MHNIIQTIDKSGIYQDRRSYYAGRRAGVDVFGEPRKIPQCLIKNDLDWIFDNAQEVLRDPPATSIQALARCCEPNSLYGVDGTDRTYYLNFGIIYTEAKPYLQKGDIDGWLAHGKARRALAKESEHRHAWHMGGSSRESRRLEA